MMCRLAVKGVLLVLLTASCSYVTVPSLLWTTRPSQSNATAEALFQEGMTHLKNRWYPAAIDGFQRVKAEFPFDSRVKDAELRLAEAYYLNRQYPEAISALKEFQALHPTNENIPFVIYHLGLAHFEQFNGIDRDQRKIEIAKGYFETVIRNYPDSPYAAMAREKLAKCVEYLVEREFSIGAFYMGAGKCLAASHRFAEILRRYREAPAAPKALYYLGECYRLEKNALKVSLAYEALRQHYPGSPFAKKAEIEWSRLSLERQDPMALLLQDGRAPSGPPAGPGTALSRGDQRKEMKLVTKKEIVHEEPRDGKGFSFRPLKALDVGSWSERKEDREEKSKAEGAGFFNSLWRWLNPFGTDEPSKEGASRGGLLFALFGW